MSRHKRAIFTRHRSSRASSHPRLHRRVGDHTHTQVCEWYRRCLGGVRGRALTVLLGSTAVLVPTYVTLSTSSAYSEAISVSQSMSISGFNPAVAQANGVKWTITGATLTLNLPNGSVLSYPLQNSPSVSSTAPTIQIRSGATPSNEVGGNCGTSFYYITNYGNGVAGVLFGFNTVSASIAYTASAWIVNDDDDRILSASYGGSLLFRTSWSHTWGAAIGTGEVFGSAYLTATLWYGVTCTSNGPSAEGYIT